MPELSGRRLPPSEIFKIDTHVDTPTASLMREGWDFGARHSFADDHTQCDLPRMEQGGIDAMVFAVYSTQAARVPAGYAMATRRALEVLARTREIVEGIPDRCGLALTAGDAIRLKAAGRRAIYLSIENGYSVGRDLANVRAFHQSGVRMLGLTHMLNNDLADSSTDPRGPEWGGLSPFGREVLAECNRLGMVVDASHASDDALRDLLQSSRSPVILSHSGCRAVCDHPRNIGDELLRALARQGGVIQINALPIAVVPTREDGRTAALSAMLLKLGGAILTPDVLAETEKEWRRIETTYPNPAATLDDYVKHLEHAVSVASIDHVGVGCDFDGGGGVAGLNDVSDYPNLTRALLAKGFDGSDLEKIWGGNTLRVFGACAQAAATG
ncbi:MAG: Membrane dipeptidase [Verrucomicrobia bacterium]|nr:Membrane dipeptidase [Verrucomicrobiota bacterium]